MNLGIMYYLLITVTAFGTTFGIASWLIIGLWICGIGISWMIHFEISEKEQKEVLPRIKWHFKTWLACLAVVIVVTSIIPSKKDMIIIAGLTMTNETIKNTAIELKDTVPALAKLINDEIAKLSKEVTSEIQEKKDESK